MNTTKLRLLLALGLVLVFQACQASKPLAELAGTGPEYAVLLGQLETMAGLADSWGLSGSGRNWTMLDDPMHNYTVQAWDKNTLGRKLWTTSDKGRYVTWCSSAADLLGTIKNLEAEGFIPAHEQAIPSWPLSVDPFVLDRGLLSMTVSERARWYFGQRISQTFDRFTDPALFETIRWHVLDVSVKSYLASVFGETSKEFQEYRRSVMSSWTLAEIAHALIEEYRQETRDSLSAEDRRVIWTRLAERWSRDFAKNYDARFSDLSHKDKANRVQDMGAVLYWAHAVPEFGRPVAWDVTPVQDLIRKLRDIPADTLVAALFVGTPRSDQ